MKFINNLKETAEPSQFSDKNKVQEQNSTQEQSEQEQTPERIFEDALRDSLSHEHDFDQEYIRNERIKRAPKIVQDFYDGKVNQFDKGLFKVLVKKKSNRSIFMLLIFLILVSYITGNLTNQGNIKVVSGYECELQSFVYDGTCYASVKIHPIAKTKRELEKIISKDKDFSGVVASAKFSAITQSEAIVEFNPDKNIQENILLNAQILRTQIDDCDIIEVVCKVKIQGEEQTLTSKVSHKVQ